MAYSDFLKTPLWRQTRASLLIKYKNCCNRCGRVKPENQLDIHHKRYLTDLTKIDLKDLALVCSKCHTAIHSL